MTPSLIKIDVAAYYLKKSHQQIFNMVDGGSVSEAGLLWVFNLAINPSGYRRELRFWYPEIKARSNGESTRYHGQDIEWVILKILPGQRQSFQSGQVDEMFQIRHNTRLGYVAQLPGRRHSCGNTYERPALDRFLKQRWLGQCAARPLRRTDGSCRTALHLKTEATK